MAITAKQVQELRIKTSAGMMDCKRALEEANGDMEAAVTALRKKGAAKSDKKSGRIAAEGRAACAVSADGAKAAIVEVNCETDFVGRDASFNAFVDELVAATLNDAPADLDALNQASLKDGSVEEVRQALVGKIGENIQVRRFATLQQGSITSYVHGSRIAVLVALEKADAELGADLAMHIAALNPRALSENELDANWVAQEKDILMDQAKASGKPAEILEKMIQGKMAKLLKENTLLGQPFVKDGSVTVADLLKQKGNSMLQFIRFEVGEGVEKKVENFAEEVAKAQGGH